MSASRAERIDALTGLRAFGALWVVLHHVRHLLRATAPDLDLAHLYAQFGYLGVDVFSFLSGFVIAHNYCGVLSVGSRSEIRRFFALRVARIFPLHVFASATVGALFLAVEGYGREFTAGGFVAQLLLVHAWGFSDEPQWNVPSWTVSSEWLCYLLFPLAALGLARLRRGAPALAIGALVLGGTIAAMIQLGHPGFAATMLPGSLRIGGAFLTGALIQRAHASGDLARLPWTPITLLAALASVALPVVSQTAAVAAFAALVLALAHDRGPISAPLRLRVVVYLGEISYSIYLMHWIVLKAIGAARLGLAPGPLLVLVLAAILGVAVATYHGVERPARRALRRRFAPARSGPEGPRSA